MHKAVVRYFRAVLAAVILSLGTFISVSAFTTGSYGSSSYGSCAAGQACSISVTSDGGLSISLTPTASGACSTNYDSVSVLTDDSNGYSLTISNNSATTNALVSGSNTISSTTGTAASPVALGINRWGYRVDTTTSGNYSTPSSFGSGPTTQLTNVNYPITPIFAQTQLSGSSDIIATNSGSSDPATTTTVWFGTCANTTIASGTYTTTLVYTAIAD
jgi:hypothetical protein